MATNNLSFTISAVNNASPALTSLAKQVNSLKNGLSSIGSGAKSVTSSLASVNSSASKSNSVLHTLGNTVTRIVGVFSGFRILNSIFSSVTSSIDTAINRIDTMDLFAQKIELITGSAENATSALEQLKESTKGTPYALDIAAQGVQNFVLRGMETQEAVDSINIWMDAVSTYGKGTNEQFESVIDAIAKMRTKGTVEMRYLNRLFAAGINPVQMYATATGRAAEEVQTALSKKEISSKEFLDVVETAMREGTNGVIKIAGNAKTFATTWSATLTNMRLAFARGWADVIDTMDEAFKVLDSDRGLKGLVAGFGTTVEKGLGLVATAIRNVLPPILQTAKSAFEYWKSYYFDPLKEYFDSFIQPVKDSMKVIKEAFSVEGEVDIAGLTQQLDYTGDGSLREALLEVAMSWENLKKITRDTWAGLNPQPAENAEPERFTFDLDGTIYDFLVTLDNIIGSIQSRIPQLLTSFKAFSDSVKNAFGGVIEVILTVAGGIAEFTLNLGSIIVPPALDLLTQGFNALATVLNFVTEAVKGFVKEKLPKLIDRLVASLNALQETKIVQSLGTAFDTLKDRIINAYDIAQQYITHKQKGTVNFVYDPLNRDQGNIVKIIDNIKKTIDRIMEALEPLRQALTNTKDSISDFFNMEIKSDDVTNAFSNLLEKVAEFSEIVADKLPKVVRIFSDFAAKVINYLRPAGEFIWNLATQYILPFAISVARAFINVGIALSPLIGLFGDLIVAIAGFILPPALTLFTNICNWIADHADVVAAGLIAIVTGFLALKTITTVTTVLQGIGTVLFDIVIPAVTTFFHIMTTEGIAAAIATLVNPVVLIPVVIAALIGLSAGLIYLYNTSDTAREKINQFVAFFLSLAPGITVTSDDVSKAFSQIGDAINWLKDVIDVFLEKVDAFFDKFDGLRTVLKTFLKGPFMDYGGWLGSNEDVSTEGLYNPFKDLGLDKIPNMKIQIPNPTVDLQAYRDTAQEAANAVKEQVQVDIPAVGAQGTQMVQTLYSNITDTMAANGAVDTSGLTAEIDQLPLEGYTVGEDFTNSLASGITTMNENVTAATSNISGLVQGTLNNSLAGDTTFQAGVNLINVFNSGFLTQASSTYQMVAVFANNIVTQLAAGFSSSEQIPNAIAVAMLSVVQKVTTDVVYLCENIREQLSSAKVSTETTTYALAEAIKNNFSTAQISACASLQKMKDDVIAKYNELQDAIHHDLSVIETDHVDFSTSTMNDYKNTISSGLDEIKGYYQDFSDYIHRELDELSSYHYQIGAAMMNSLATGINDNRAQVETVEGALVQTLKDVFEQGMGIHSPADQWIWYGQMLIAGLIQGMSADKVQKFIENMINDMNESFKNGSFNADQTVNFLSEQGTLDLIGRVTGMDVSSLAEQQIAYPLAGGQYPITSYFGLRDAPTAGASSNHGAVDIGAPMGTPILSILDGTVSQAGWNGGYGNSVTVDHGNGLKSLYGHMSAVGTNTGASVAKGTQIGLVGSTGVSTGPHLHLGMYKDGTAIDPLPYLQGAGVLAGNSLASTIQNAYNKKYHPELLASAMSGNQPYDISAGASQWSGLVLQALSMLGQPASLLNAVLATLQKESSGNPNAINKEDINWINGTPSKGLMQVIDPTFQQYALPGYNTNIWDPLSNILASLNYQLHRYGGIEAHLNGYAVGTRNVPYDMPAMIHKGEAIIPASQNPYSNSGGDYLADLFNNVFDSGNINSLGFDLSGISTGSTNSNINNNLNNVFNIHNDNDVNADKNVSNIEAMLHKLLQDGMRAGSSR